MSSNEKSIKSDIVFFAHGHNETERYLPLMVGLKKKGIRSLLFFQDYDYKDGLSLAQQIILKEHELNVADYSYFLRKDTTLRLATVFVKFFRDIFKTQYFYNKFRGLRSKLLKRRMSRVLASNMIKQISPKACVFDTIALVNYSVYPYGSYYIKETLKQLGVVDLCIHHGGTGHLFEIKEEIKDMDYHKIYVPNEHEKEVSKARCANKNAEVISLGDPRFDKSWKEYLRQKFSKDIFRRIEALKMKESFKILYLSPNLEHIGKENEKYRSLFNIARVARQIPGAILLIKPHPRYRSEKKIRKIMLEAELDKFVILDNEPLVCYADYVDFIVSSTSSALHDVLPEAHEKVVIYDDFSDSAGLENIFKTNFTYINNYDELLRFFGSVAKKRNSAYSLAKENNIANFCKKWVAGGNCLDNIVNRIVDDIAEEVEKTNEVIKKI